MPTPTELPAIDAELDAFLAAERALPAVSDEIRDRIFDRVARALGWSGPGGGGVAGAAVTVLLVLSIGAAAYLGAGDDAPLRPDVGGDRAVGPAVPPRTAGTDPLPAWFTDANRPARVIAGRVMHGQRPVAGARVVLTSMATRTGLVRTSETTTDTGGAFDLGAQVAAVYDVTATWPGLGDGHVRVDAFDPVADPPPDQLVIRLSGCEHLFYGTIRDASGGVVAGASVIRALGQQADIPVGAGAISDAGGRYELCVPAGPAAAIVRAPGYGSMTIFETVYGRLRFDLELVPEASLVGRVVIDPDDTPVANALVWLRPATYPERVRSSVDVVVADRAGRFRFTGVAPGRHRVVGQTDRASSRGAEVVVEAGRESAEIVLRLDALSTVVTGTVVEHGRPVAGARVFGAADGQRIGAALPTDREGRFALRLRPSTTIGFDVEGYEVLSPSSPIAPGSGPVQIQVAALGSIRGLVKRDGAGVADAVVTGIGPGVKRPEATTDATGAFVLRGLPAGRYRLFGTAHGAAAFTTDGRATLIELGRGERRDGIVVEVDGGASVEGRVVDQNGRPVPQVAVQYRHATLDDICNAITDDAGAFRCPILAGGAAYTPTVRPDRASAIYFRPATGASFPPIDIRDGSTHITGQILRVTVARARIAGRVVTQGGAPYPDVSVRALEEVTAYTPGTAKWMGVRSAITDASGRFQIDVWGGATYTVHARAAGGAEAAVPRVDGGAADITIRLAEPGGIRGTLAGFRAAPQVMVTRLGNTFDAAMARVEGDTFAVEGLTPGSYSVVAVAGTQASGERVDVRAGEDAVVSLRARAPTRIAGHVVDFTTGEPLRDVRCTILPYVEGSDFEYWWGMRAPPTDEHGRFEMDGPSGPIAVACLRANEDAAARAVGGAARGPLTIPIVASEPLGNNGIGANYVVGTDAAGFVHTIVELRPGGSGELAGLRPSDVIRTVDGRDVSVLTRLGFRRLIGSKALGTRIELGVRRGGTHLMVPVTIEAAWWK